MNENLLGHKLKLEREAKGFTLEKISDELRIPLKFLEGMERNDFTGFPGPTYERAFLRTYAKHLGLNGDELMLLYRELKGDTTVTPAIEPEDEFTRETFHLPFRKRAGFKITEQVKFRALIALSLIFIILTFLGIRQCSSKGAAGAQTASSGSGQPRMVLTADVTDECWFEIVSDNEPLNKMLLKAGDQKKWEASNEFVLVNIGNKDAVKFELDGKPVDFGPHKGKSIKDFTLRRQGAENGK